MKYCQITPQTCDMGYEKGKYIFSNLTLEQALNWFEENLNDWGIITINFKNGDILRRFDYDLYNLHQFYHHLNGWEYKLLVDKIESYNCFMNKDIIISLKK